MTTHTNPAISSRTVFSLPYRDHSWASAAPNQMKERWWMNEMRRACIRISPLLISILKPWYYVCSFHNERLLTYSFLLFTLSILLLFFYNYQKSLMWMDLANGALIENLVRSSLSWKLCMLLLIRLWIKDESIKSELLVWQTTGSASSILAWSCHIHHSKFWFIGESYVAICGTIICELLLHVHDSNLMNNNAY
jgi:hypothetical protein